MGETEKELLVTLKALIHAVDEHLIAKRSIYAHIAKKRLTKAADKARVLVAKIEGEI